MRTKLVLLLILWSVGVQAQKKKVASPVKEASPPDKHIVYCGAVYPGGNDSMIKYVRLNLRYPEAAREAGVQGRVRLKFFVNETGKVSDAVVVRSIGAGCDQEAVRVATAMPHWQPATFNGKPVKSIYYLPVSFKLE